MVDSKNTEGPESGFRFNDLKRKTYSGPVLKLENLVIAILCFFTPVPVQAESYALLQTKVNERLPAHSQCVLSVRDLAKSEIFAHGEMLGQDRLLLGSLAKLWVSGVALTLERSVDRDTEILVTGIRASGSADTVYLKGRGNALLTADELKHAVSTLVEAGVQTVRGDVVADERFFHIEDWARDREGSAYGSPAALGLNLHTVRVAVRPTQPRLPPKVDLEPVNQAARIAVSAGTVTSSRNDFRITRLDDLSYKVEGNIPLGAGPVASRFPLDDPALYAAGILKNLLEEADIRVEGGVRMGRAPDDATLLAEIPGPPLDEVLRDMNHHSLNVVADNLLLSLGAERFGPPGTRENGVKAVREFLESLDLPMDEVEVYDGSGLSDKNRVSVDFMTQFLVKVSTKPWFERFKNTLPRPGYEGTVKNMPFRDERFRVKTGRLEDVYALAGYGVDGAGKDVAFCFIVNGPGVGMLPNMDEIGADVLRSIAGETVH